MDAGPPGRRRSVSTPSGFPALLGSDLDWRDATEPQENLNARRLDWPRGKVLGGSGSLSAMIHLRGCRADYDAWCALGNPGWGFDDLAELWTDPPPSSRTIEPNKLTEAFLEACKSCGIKRYGEFTGPQEEGAGIYPTARVNGERWSAVCAFLTPALKRGNLTVWTGVQAVRVVTENGRATAVEYLLKGSRQQVRAEHEVILCAGAVGSPKLLLLSGIGPAEDLDRLGIQVVSPLSGVGANLQDPPAVSLRWTCGQPVSLDGAATWRNARRVSPEKKRAVGVQLDRGRSVPEIELGSPRVRSGDFVRAALFARARIDSAGGSSRIHAARRVARTGLARSSHATIRRSAEFACHRSCLLDRARRQRFAGASSRKSAGHRSRFAIRAVPGRGCVAARCRRDRRENRQPAPPRGNLPHGRVRGLCH